MSGCLWVPADKMPEQPHPFYDIPGSGFPREGTSMYNQFKTGWQSEWTPAENHFNVVDWEVNPVLLRDLPEGLASDEIAKICEAHGRVSSVRRPEGQTFAFVSFSDNEEAKRCIAEGLTNADGAALKVQPAKVAAKEVVEWRASLRAAVRSTTGKEN